MFTLPCHWEEIGLTNISVISGTSGKVSNQTATAIRAWTFLFICIRSHDIGGSQVIENALHSMNQLLSSSDNAIRLSAGEAITVIFLRCNLGSFIDNQGVSRGERDSGLEAIITRMKDIEKNIGEASRKSKRDRTEQRGEFREFLKIIHVR